jgi:superfamily II DNA/RNA helicase
VNVVNLSDTNTVNGQVVVTTLGKIKGKMAGRDKLDLSHLKMLVVDEADYFFEDNRNLVDLKVLHKAISAFKV